MPPRVLFAWELGRNFGHVTLARGVALALGDRAEIWAALRDPALARRFAPDLPARLLPAPVASLRPRMPGLAGGRSYADDLRHCGWDDEAGLGALVESWRSLLDLVRPDILVADSAPTAMLAARGTGIPVANLGFGYTVPPRLSPMPAFLWWKAPRDAAAEAGEALVTEVANRVLARAGGPPLGAFRDVLEAGPELRLAIDGIDHYPDAMRAGGPPPLGPIAALDAGHAVDWLPGGRRRILAYLRHGGLAFDAAVEALAGAPGDWDVVLASPGIPAAAAARLERAPVRVVDGPVRMAPLLGRCDLGIAHASASTSAAFAMAGVPQVMLPTQMEQLMLARALADARLGLATVSASDGAAMRGLIGRALESAEIRAAAAAVSARLGAARDGAEAAAERILERLAA